MVPKSTLHQPISVPLINALAVVQSLSRPKIPSTASDAGVPEFKIELAVASHAAFAFTPHMRAKLAVPTLVLAGTVQI